MIIICVSIALLGHSSSYFVFPLLIGIILLREILKKIQIGLLVSTLIVSVFLQNTFLSQFTRLMFLLYGFGGVRRSTQYLVDDIYDSNVASINALLPQTLMTLSIIYYSNRQELNSIFTRSLLLATILVNIFFSVPLISRSLTTFWIIAIAGCVPVAFRTNKKARIVMCLLQLMQLYFAYKAYINPSFRMLPFKFIWE